MTKIYFIVLFFNIKMFLCTRELAQQLRSLIALVEIPGLATGSQHMVANNPV